MADPLNLPPAPTNGDDRTYRPLAELIGQTVEVTAVEDLDGIPILIVGDTGFIVTGEWGQACATHLGAELASRGAEALRVTVVEEPAPAGVGLQAAPDDPAED